MRSLRFLHRTAGKSGWNISRRQPVRPEKGITILKRQLAARIRCPGQVRKWYPLFEDRYVTRRNQYFVRGLLPNWNHLEAYDKILDKPLGREQLGLEIQSAIRSRRRIRGTPYPCRHCLANGYYQKR